MLSNKIKILQFDMDQIFKDYENLESNVKRIVESCETPEQIANCSGLVTDIKTRMYLVIDNILRKYKLINLLSFKTIEHFYKSKFEEKYMDLSLLYSKKVVEICKLKPQFK